jgi:glycosidase
MDKNGGEMAAGINVEEDLKSEKSIFAYYKELISLRKKYDIIRDGDFTILDKDSDATFMYSRKTKNEVLYVMCNLTEQSQEINTEITNNIKGGECIITNVKKPCENNMMKPYETSVWIKKL